ncbi:MAG TPA: alpha/beta hydrolase [Terriglobales bacterium]|nr:alpha/beta hydrolase [Terriglobales bacterium]
MRVIRVSGFILLFALIISIAQAQEPLSLKLWPKGAPGVTANASAESVVNRPDLDGAKGKVTRITNVTDPVMTIYRAGENNTGSAMLVFPGGGYRWLAFDIEGTEICEWLVSKGVNCVLVKYRVYLDQKPEPWKQPLEDAQRAMGIVRQHAKEWKIDPAKIGVMGFSAGAHLSAALSNHPQRTYAKVDSADELDCRPNFAVLLYPGMIRRSADDQRLSVAVQPNANTPPTFLFQTEDDPVHVENSLLYYGALAAAKVPAEMHLYPTGGHGYGMRAKYNAVAGIWPELLMKWLADLKIIHGNK